MLQKLFFDLGLFLAKKQSKLIKNEENWQNQNCLIKFSEIWYVNASQRKKIQQKNYFSILVFFGIFLPYFAKKTAKIDQK